MSGKPRAKPPVRRRRPRWVGRLLRVGIPVVAIAAIGAGGAWLWRSGWLGEKIAVGEAALLTGTARAGLVLNDIEIAGRVETTQPAVMAALKLRRGMPLLAVAPDALRERLEALPWVRQATVERRLPDRLYVRIEEYRPLALWQHDRRFSLIGAGGEVIEDPDVGRFTHLLQVVGDDAPAHAAGLIAMLGRQPELQRRVTAAVLVSGRRWNLHLDNGIDVRLPEENSAAAWTRLAELDRKDRLLEKDLVSIDLRDPDRLVVRLTPAAAAKRRTAPPAKPGSNT
ncbi:MAG: FtsQ-type POTRA domain-containing protein [Dongiaceae bacterium]